MWHVVTYWLDGFSQYRGAFATRAEACKHANTYHSQDRDFRVTVVMF